MFNKRIVKAFTLLELIVVIVVLGILAMLAVPTFNTVKEKSAESVANKNASAVQRDFNAQAALAQSDSSITPSATGAWVINGTSYSYTATAGNTGQNVVATKASSGGSGGGSGYSYSTRFTSADYLNGSCIYGSGNNITFACASGDMKTALANLFLGSMVRITYDDSTVEEYAVVSFNAGTTTIEMSTPVTIRYGVNAYSSVEI